ncbi:MAG: circularly permuted type 2 ATP-grasp protein [Micropepsaceae bacterium]
MRISSALLEGYAPLPGAADELVGADGEMRDYWRQLIDGLSGLGGTELKRLEATALRMVRDNGVTYNVYGDPDAPTRPWDLDIAPLAISSDEWRELEAGLVQRARLLDRILADVYGPQSLFRSGDLPAALIAGSPHFLRPFHGAKPPGGVFLHFAAVDLGRLPDGGWTVLADRTEAPAGAGYALENRIIVSQMLPELFRDCRVERLAAFFGGFRDKLFQLTGVSRPHAVLLTPGPLNEAYFEHAYLARYLGFTLVEGEDLTVRDRHVYLKTLAGPRKVDLILRRQDSDYCDPLELRSESALGVPGITEAVRAGNVVVANALGSGVAETRPLMPFLPGLCRSLLGEDSEAPQRRNLLGRRSAPARPRGRGSRPPVDLADRPLRAADPGGARAGAVCRPHHDSGETPFAGRALLGRSAGAPFLRAGRGSRPPGSARRHAALLRCADARRVQGDARRPRPRRRTHRRRRIHAGDHAAERRDLKGRLDSQRRRCRGLQPARQPREETGNPPYRG